MAGVCSLNASEGNSRGGRTSWDGSSATPPREDVAFLASQPYRGGEDASLELRETADGARAVMAYSSVDELVAKCGPAQPWIAFPTDRLDEVRDVSGGDVVLWNVELDPDRRHR